MDSSRFDAWTRRRFGLVMGSGVAALAGLNALDNADARKKKKKRCKKLAQSCGGKKKCCKKLTCADSFSAQNVCCTPLQGVCVDETQCCAGANIICDLVNSLDGKRCCVFEGDPCTVDNDCCQGTVCAGTCQPIPSDRALKANFGSVDPADMLARVRELPISTWNYTSDDPAIRHIGPMAQDFAAAFGVGVDDRHIHPSDGQGVTLAAIQGLAMEIEMLRAENVRLAARIAVLT